MNSVWASVREAYFEVSLYVVSNVQRALLKEKTRLIDDQLFSPFVEFFWLSIISPLSLSLCLSSDKTVKIWSSKVWRKRWQLNWFLCQLSLLIPQPLICDLLTSSNEKGHWKHRFQGNQGVSFLCQGVKWRSRGKIRIQRQETIAFQMFSTANLKVPFRCDTTWTR